MTKDKIHAPKNKLPLVDDINEKRVRMRKNNSEVNCFPHILCGIDAFEKALP